MNPMNTPTQPPAVGEAAERTERLRLLVRSELRRRMSALVRLEEIKRTQHRERNWRSDLEGAESARRQSMLFSDALDDFVAMEKSVAAFHNLAWESFGRLFNLRNESRTAEAWQKIPRYIRDELEAMEGRFYAATKGGRS